MASGTGGQKGFCEDPNTRDQKCLETWERQCEGNQGSNAMDHMRVAQGSDEKEAGVPP